MANGGSITVRWSSPATGTVAIAGPSAGSPTPGSITTDTTYAFTEDGMYTVTVTAFGVTVVNRDVWLEQGQKLVFDGTPSITDFLSAVEPTTSTTAALAAVGNAINTAGKYAGKMVFNTTTGKPVWANGPLANDLWKDATGATAHTPI